MAIAPPELFVGAQDHKLFADWLTEIRNPEYVWTTEFRTIASRAVALVCNDTFACSMVGAKIRETHGPRGMRLRSTYTQTPGSKITTIEKKRRIEIEAILATCSLGNQIDAGCVLTRRMFDEQMDWIATVMGDVWAVWVWKPGRPNCMLSGGWRIVTPDRVCNPDNKANTETICEGVQYNANGIREGIWVKRIPIGCYWLSTVEEKWDYFPMVNPENGMRTVIHHVGFQLPGMSRGISMFSPAIMTLRQMQGTIESTVIGKRVQSMHPIAYLTDDEEELATAKKNKSRLGDNAVIGPMSVVVGKYGSASVQFLNPNFSGSDIRAFLQTMWMPLSSMWGLPWQVVLCAMGEASLASARAGLDQNARSCEGFGAKYEENVSRPIDESIIREASILGMIDLGSDPKNWNQIMDGRYSRPPKYSTDREKDAKTISHMIRAKISPTTAHECFGYDFIAEVEQTRRDVDFCLENGLPDPTIVDANIIAEGMRIDAADETAKEKPEETPADPTGEEDNNPNDEGQKP